MGRNSLVSIGRQAFEVLDLINSGKSIKDIKEIFLAQRQNNSQDEKQRVACFVEKLKTELLKSGWISGKEGMYSLTKSGSWFLKSIYENPKLKEKLKE